MECISIFSPVQATCNRWLPNKRRHCTYAAGLLKERQYAERLRLEILDGEYPKRTERFEVLMELAEAVHCRRYHRTHQQIMATVDCWTAELDRANHSNSYRSNRNRQTTPYRASRTPKTTRLLPTHSLTAAWNYYQTQSYNSPVRRTDTPPATRTAISSVRRTDTTPVRRGDTIPVGRTDTPPVTNTYTPPVTRSQTANRPRAIPSRPTPPRFEPRRRLRLDTPEAIVDLAYKPLGPMERKNGHIYMFTRDSDPGYVKIGWSTNPTRRMREWEQSCHYKPVLVYQSPRIPHAFRAEQLIFTQLAEWRYNDMRCINEDITICGRQHKEWFRLRKRDAREVIERWVDWVLTLPYHEDGGLEDEWETYPDRWLELCHQNPAESDLDLDFGSELPPPDLTAEDEDEDEDGEQDDESDSDSSSSSSSSSNHERDAEPSSPQQSEPPTSTSSSVPDDCAICYESLGPPTAAQTLSPCTVCRNRPWHDECIRKWIEMSPLCPMCRGRDSIVVDGRAS